MVALPTATPVTVKLPEVAPWAIGAAAVTVAMPGALLTRLIVTPEGAPWARVMVPARVLLIPTSGPAVLSVMLRSATVTWLVAGVKDVAEAVMVAVPAVAPAVTVKTPGGVVVLAGTEATATLLLARL